MPIVIARPSSGWPGQSGPGPAMRWPLAFCLDPCRHSFLRLNLPEAGALHDASRGSFIIGQRASVLECPEVPCGALGMAADRQPAGGCPWKMDREKMGRNGQETVKFWMLYQPLTTNSYGNASAQTFKVATGHRVVAGRHAIGGEEFN